MTNEVTVTRIEHRVERVGPYCQKPGLPDPTDMLEGTIATSRRPSPLDDKKLWNELGCKGWIDDIYHSSMWGQSLIGLRYSFPSDDHITRWFTPTELRNLKEGGWVVRKYKVPAERVAIGDSQCVFDSTAAVEVEEREIAA